MALPSDRISFAIFGDDLFFGACSSQPPSRLMSATAPPAMPQEQQLPHIANSTARYSEPLASACMPTGAASSDEPAPITSHNVHEPTSFPASTAMTRCQSSDADRGRDTPTCYYHGHAPTVGKSDLKSHFSRQGMDGIFRNVRAYLAAKRHGSGSLKTATEVVDENHKPLLCNQTASESLYSELPEDQYLISADDIKSILDIVITDLCSIHDDKNQPNCRSLLFAKCQCAKPTLRTQNIVPGVPAIADPATTFCSIQPCFSSCGGLGFSQSPASSPKATYSMLPKLPHLPSPITKKFLLSARHVISY